MKDLRSTPLAQSMIAALDDPEQHYFMDVGCLAGEVTDECAHCGKPAAAHTLVPPPGDE